MNRLRTILTAAAVGTALAVSSAAMAAATTDSYEYVTGAVNGASTVQTAYSLTLGQSITIPVYLQETVPAGGSSFLSSEGGLFGGGFAVTQTTLGTGTITGEAGDLTTFPGGVISLETGATIAGAATSLSGNPANSTASLPNAAGLIALGTITITPTAAGTTSFNTGGFDDDAGGFTITFNNGYDLDLGQDSVGDPVSLFSPTASETFMVTATAVPEPASIALVGAAAMGLVLRRRPA